MLNPGVIDEETRAVRDGFTLSSRFYTEPQVLAAEREAIFGKAWQFALHESLIPDPGNYALARVGRHEVIIARDRDGSIKAMRNVCAHRGSRIVTKSGSRFTLQCPYHGWTYDLDGRLRAAPGCDSDPRVKRGETRLRQVRIGSFRSLLFVSLASDGSPLNEVLSPLATIRYDWPNLRLAHTKVYSVRCNWKVAVENALECYHCPIAHPSFSNLFDVHEYSWRWQGVCAISGAARKDGEAAPYLAARAASEGSAGGDFYCVWPNLQLEVYPGPPNLQVVRWLPEECDRTLCVREFYFDDSFEETARADYVEFIDRIYREDIPLCENVYSNMAAQAFDRGIVHDGEGGMSEYSLRRFHLLNLEALSSLARPEGATGAT